jgi:catechol 2,3-dioxygenase-like lactoylglutathione lyase family enzyme
MINGLHAIVYAKDADKARAFFGKILGFSSVDAGQGWLIYAAPPAEVGVHPAEGDEHGSHELHLMCDDIYKTVIELKAKGVHFTRPPKDYGWGIMATLEIPGGGAMSIYQPRHPRAHGDATEGDAKRTNAKKTKAKKTGAKKKSPARRTAKVKSASGKKK